jgi:hypothetical protein
MSSEQLPRYKVGQVFVPGGQPTVTYNPRTELGLESKVRDYLSERGKILSVAGPTKTGKTVLLRNILTGRTLVWLSAGEIESLGGLWDRVNDKLAVATKTTESVANTATKSSSGSLTGNLVVLQSNKGGSQTDSNTQRVATTRERVSSHAAIEAMRSADAVLVIDDFHYLNRELQAKIVRGLKEAVFDGLSMIVATVPHRGEDAVRAEKEMTGRVAHLRIPFWTKQELGDIASHGFAALNVSDPDRVADRLVGQAFESPHLMQEFCLQLGKQNGIVETQAIRQVLSAPEPIDAFFKERCDLMSKEAFERLAGGPRIRGRERRERIVRRGRTDATYATDIYGAVLEAIAYTGPLTKITYDQLRQALSAVLIGEMPTRDQISRVLEQMAKIAKEVAKGDEPVVDFVAMPDSTLHISDPFFAYFLRWCTTTPNSN